MNEPPIVADAGPLIGLARIGLLSLLQDLYGTVVIPTAVSVELRTIEDRPGSRALLKALEEGWLQPEEIRPSGDLEILLQVLGRGEAEAILLADQRPCRFLFLDEKRGRAVARRRGIQVVGTGGILLAAKQKGLLDSVSPVLDRLAAAGYRLSLDLRAEVLRRAGEDES